MYKLRKVVRFSLLTVAVILLATAALAADKEKLIIFHAGSLSVPFKMMEQQFEKEHPTIDILHESGGSTKMAKMISELGKPADIMASADYVVIDKNLIPKFADFNIRFATNQMVLCYTEQSKYADTITSKNWPEILAKPDVVWGYSDPNIDPCGYRSLMVLQLAEKHYQMTGLYEKLMHQRKEEWIRPRAPELIALLQSGDMDYAWEYLSVAVQHNLKYVILDKEVNLSDYTLNDFYKNAQVEVSGKKPGTTTMQTGKAITYGITILKNAPNKAAANLFLQYLLNPKQGLTVLKNMGQPPFIPARISSEEMKKRLSPELQALVEVKNIVERDNMKIELINPIDTLVLTQQGREILKKAILDGDYSTQVVNTDYNEWKSLVEKGLYIVIGVADHSRYIIPTGLKYLQEGAAFRFSPNKDGSTKTNRIQFNNFRPVDFLNKDINAVREQASLTQKTSLMLQLSGNDVTFKILINGQDIYNSPSSEKVSVWGGGGFSYGIPINKYLHAGANIVQLEWVDKMSNSASLLARVANVEKQDDVSFEHDIDLKNNDKGVKMDLSVKSDAELIDQHQFPF